MSIRFHICAMSRTRLIEKDRISSRLIIPRVNGPIDGGSTLSPSAGDAIGHDPIDMNIQQGAC